MKTNQLNSKKNETKLETDDSFKEHFTTDYISVVESTVSFIDDNDIALNTANERDRRSEENITEAIKQMRESEKYYQKMSRDIRLRRKSFLQGYSKKLEESLDIYEDGSQLFKSTKVLIGLIESEIKNLV